MSSPSRPRTPLKTTDQNCTPNEVPESPSSASRKDRRKLKRSTSEALQENQSPKRPRVAEGIYAAALTLGVGPESNRGPIAKTKLLESVETDEITYDESTKEWGNPPGMSVIRRVQALEAGQEEQKKTNDELRIEAEKLKTKLEQQKKERKADRKELEWMQNQIAVQNTELSILRPETERSARVIIGEFERRNRDLGRPFNSTNIISRNEAAHEPDVQSAANALERKNVVAKYAGDFKEVYGCGLSEAKALFGHEEWVKLVNKRAKVVFQQCRAQDPTAPQSPHFRFRQRVDMFTERLHATPAEQRAYALGQNGPMYQERKYLEYYQI